MRILLFLLLLATSVWAQPAKPVKVRPSQMAQAGVHVRTYSTLYYLDETRTLIGMDTPPFTIKRTGVMARLWFMRFDSNGRLAETKKADLRFPGIEQANLTPDLKSVMVVSHKGTELYKVDVATGQVSTVMSHAKGQPGFVIDPAILALTEGKLYTIGNVYDAEDFQGPKVFAELDTNATGAAAFKPLFELKPLESKLPELFVASELSPKAMFFGYREGGDDRFSRWTPAGGMQLIDQARKYLGSWGEQHRWLYSVERQDGKSELMLADGVTGEKRSLGTSSYPYLYPVLSKEGNTAVVATEERSTGATYWVAEDRNGYKLRPLLENVGRNTIRVSLSGQTVVLFNPQEGLQLFTLF